MRVAILATACVALLAVPIPAIAQGQTSTEPPSASNLKGPPNANGYGKSADPATTGDQTKDTTPSASDMKGPPNANGYKHP